MSIAADLANIALTHLGNGKEIQNLASENTAEARAIRRVYNLCRDQTFRDFPWGFATRFATLALVEEDPTSEWAFSYRKTPDMMFVRRIISGTRNDDQDTRVPFRIASDSVGELIFTDKEDAEIEYTILIEAESRWPSDFRHAFAFLIASMVAPRLTSGDPFKLGDKAIQKYFLALGNAQANSGNEEQAEREPESEFIRARD